MNAEDAIKPAPEPAPEVVASPSTPKPKRKKPGPKTRAKRRAIAAAIAAGQPHGQAPAQKPQTVVIAAPPTPRVAQPAAPPATIASMPPPPDDPLAMNAWAHNLVARSLYDAALDPDLSPRERRKEIKTLGATLAKLIPQSRLYDAEQTVKRTQREIETKQAEKRGARLEPVPKRAPAV